MKYHSGWNHEICPSCFEEFQPGRTPVRFVINFKVKSPEKICCNCGATMVPGEEIPYRLNPDECVTNQMNDTREE